MVFWFLIVNVRLVEPFRGIVGAPKLSLIEGGHVTLRFADAVLPLPPFVDVTAPVVLVKLPPDVPVTLTLNVQEPFAGIVAPDRLTLLVPAVAAIVPPPHDPLRPFGVASAIPAGKASVNATPISATAFPLLMVKLSVVPPFNMIWEAPNDLLIDGGSSTVMLAVAVPPDPPSLDVTLPVVLVIAPVAVPVMFTLNVHDELGASVAPDKVTLPVPAAAVMVPPPQDPVSPLGVATARPVGNMSANPTPVIAMEFAAGLTTVNVKPVLALSATVAAPNALVIVGGTTTVTEEVLLTDPAPV